MSGIGYSSPDWGMSAYYAQEDAKQRLEGYQEYLDGQEREIYEQNKERVLLFVAQQANQHRLELKDAGIDDYDLQGWREFLADGAALESNEIMRAVTWAIKDGEDFTFCDEIDGLADKWIAHQQSEIQSKLFERKYVFL